MTAVVEFKGQSLEGLLASLPSRLSWLLNVDSDDWTKPETLTSKEVEAAKWRLRAAEELLRPADQKTLAAWLSTLGILCAGQTSADDAKVKMAAYVPLLSAPASILTKQTLADAGREFKWFPSFQELSAFLDARSWVMRKLVARLKALSEMTPAIEHHPGSDWNQLTPEQKAELDRRIAEAKSHMTSPNPQPWRDEIMKEPA